MALFHNVVFVGCRRHGLHPGVTTEKESAGYRAGAKNLEGSESHAPLNRSSRREEALIDSKLGMRNAEFDQSLLTSAATWLREAIRSQEATGRFEILRPVFPIQTQLGEFTANHREVPSDGLAIVLGGEQPLAVRAELQRLASEDLRGIRRR